MKRIFLSLVVGASLSAASLAPAAAQSIPSGSYQQSCTDVHVRDGQLVARCTNPQGTRIRTSMSLGSCRGGDIANSNGQLTCNGGGNGYGYHHHGYGNNNGYNGYGNNGNGNNGYGNNGYGNNGYAARGSYQQSCNNINNRGGMLTATCPGTNGTMMTTSIDPRQCRGSDIANRNGRLVCQ